MHKSLLLLGYVYAIPAALNVLCVQRADRYQVADQYAPPSAIIIILVLILHRVSAP